MGFDSIIVDDGWQTLDTARGYAFTGDWQPERMPDMKGFVDGCHRLGVKLDGEFEALSPAANYPVLIGRAGGKQIVGLFGDVFVKLDGRATEKIDVINGKNSETVVLSSAQDLGPYRFTIRDCQGKPAGSGQVRLDKGARDFTVPVSGLLTLEPAQ